MFLGNSLQAQNHAIDRLDKKGYREEQEKTVAGVAPKAQKKDRSYKGCHGNGA
jgi:hypothetical protein